MSEKQTQETEIEEEYRVDLDLDNRSIYIGGLICDDMALELHMALDKLYRQSDSAPAYVYVCYSHGGYLPACFYMVDIVSLIKFPLYVIICGYAYSAAAVFAASFKRGYRYALDSATLMIHELTAEADTKFSDFEQLKRDVNKSMQRMVNILQKKSGASKKQLGSILKKDTFMSAKEAVEFGKYGLIDGIYSGKENLCVTKVKASVKKKKK